jgi:hypothetical protein
MSIVLIFSLKDCENVRLHLGANIMLAFLSSEIYKIYVTFWKLAQIPISYRYTQTNCENHTQATKKTINYLSPDN